MLEGVRNALGRVISHVTTYKLSIDNNSLCNPFMHVTHVHNRPGSAHSVNDVTCPEPVSSLTSIAYYLFLNYKCTFSLL